MRRRTPDSQEGLGRRVAERVGRAARVVAGVLHDRRLERQRRRRLAVAEMDPRPGAQRLVVEEPDQRRLRLGGHLAPEPIHRPRYV